MPFISRRKLVEALYKGALGRTPDEDGARHHERRLRDGVALEVVVSDFVKSEEWQIQRRIHKPAEPLPTFLPNSSFAEMTTVEPASEVKKHNFGDFYRGETCNFLPYLEEQSRPNYLEHFVLRGHAPDRPIVLRSSKVTAFGSCFAVNVTKHLAAMGFDLSKNRAPGIHISRIDEGLVNVHALLGQFEWALEGIAPEGDLWHGPKAKSFPIDESVRLETREVFKATTVFIITLGLSEIWYDELTGGIFWRAVPMRYFDPTRHKFRVCSLAETLTAIHKMRSIIRKHCDAEIIFTLSPIPLWATFRDQSCLTASVSSKAILRAALDEFFRSPEVAADERCRYFPAYEMVTELFASRFLTDGRHPHPFIIDAIMKVFEAFYCESSMSKINAEAAFKDAQFESARAAIDFELKRRISIVSG